MKDLVIIGAGPAGLTAAIYGKRAGLDLVVIEKFAPGGQVMTTDAIENYPGFIEPIAGWELVSNIEQQAKRFEVNVLNGDVKSIEKENEKIKINLADGSIVESKAVIIATGSSHSHLDVMGEKEFLGKGVSYCATCDGAFYKDKKVAVVGGGNTALQEAIFLTKFASQVFIIHRRDQFRGDKILQDRVLANDKITVIYDSVVETINGDIKVRSATLRNKKTKETTDLEVDGVFIFVGITPNTSYLSEKLLNEKGEVNVDINMRTQVAGIFAAGDLRSNSIRQVVSACSDGAIAALKAYDFIVLEN